MSNIFQSKVGEISVKSIADEQVSFKIPSYQRGYRWQSKQVFALLDDLNRKWGDVASGSEKYLLQPIVLKSHGDGFIVVDGQQRLTTLKIILDELNVKAWTVEPLNSEEFDLLSEACKENCARMVRQTMVKEKIRAHLSDIIFVYYMLDEDEDEHQAFERLNAGKIGLTDAELIRALFIPQDNQWAKEVASEWEQIESALHDDTFWYMFNSVEPETSTRIDRLFKIVTRQEQSRIKGSAFWVLESSLKSTGEDHHDCDWWWNRVMNLFWMLRHCYDNIKLYHYLGWFAHTTDVRFERVYSLYERDRVNFTKNLQRNILGQDKDGVDLGCNSLYMKDDQLGYDFRKSDGGFRYLHPYANNDGFPSCFLDKNGIRIGGVRTSVKELRSFLLLFNLEILNQREKSVVRFPFKTYKDQAWEIEHIASHNPDSTTSQQDDEEKKDVLTLEEKNMVFNLALLDKRTNCTYKDKPFNEKRQYIFGRGDKKVQGSPFVPIATREVFSKAYSNDPRSVTGWYKSDATDYMKYMTKVFSEMWNEAEG